MRQSQDGKQNIKYICKRTHFGWVESCSNTRERIINVSTIFAPASVSYYVYSPTMNIAKESERNSQPSACLFRTCTHSKQCLFASVYSYSGTESFVSELNINIYSSGVRPHAQQPKEKLCGFLLYLPLIWYLSHSCIIIIAAVVFVDAPLCVCEYEQRARAAPWNNKTQPAICHPHFWRGSWVTLWQFAKPAASHILGHRDMNFGGAETFLRVR